MQIHDLKAPKGARKKKNIVGRGRGSGSGGTSGRGENGQRSRRGRGIVGSLEGGQMPLIRRLPKVGFRSKNPTIYQVVNIGDLNCFKENSVINAEILKSTGLIKSLNKPFKILGRGKISKPLIIQAKAVSKKAMAKIINAGGKVEA